jgi:hypothetical protein
MQQWSSYIVSGEEAKKQKREGMAWAWQNMRTSRLTKSVKTRRPPTDRRRLSHTTHRHTHDTTGYIYILILWLFWYPERAQHETVLVYMAYTCLNTTVCVLVLRVRMLYRTYVVCRLCVFLWVFHLVFSFKSRVRMTSGVLSSKHQLPPPLALLKIISRRRVDWVYEQKWPARKRVNNIVLTHKHKQTRKQQ